MGLLLLREYVRSSPQACSIRINDKLIVNGNENQLLIFLKSFIHNCACWHFQVAYSVSHAIYEPSLIVLCHGIAKRLLDVHFRILAEITWVIFNNSFMNTVNLDVFLISHVNKYYTKLFVFPLSFL